jgi:hypothetical protein
MRNFLPLLLLLAACPEQTGLPCPANTSIVGQYTLAFATNHDAGECQWTDDGGVKKPLALEDAGVRGATLCVGDAPDGGPLLQLLIPGKGGVRSSDLLPDGGFHFVSDPVVAQGTKCQCDVNVLETFDGHLLDGNPFALRPDGGLPPITGLSATLTDELSSDAGTPCNCTLPCSLAYSIAGSPF